MDDAMLSLDDTQEMKQLRVQLSELLRKGGLWIRKWCSNSSEVLKEIPEEERASGIVDLEESELPSIKTLGVRWDAEKDVIGFSHSEVKQEITTKRSLLSVIARLFDPLQLLAPFTVRAKFLLQQAWMAGLGWDERFPPALEEQARKWIDELARVTEFEVPRCLHRGSPLETSIHTFADASKLAYAAVVYVRDVYVEGTVSVMSVRVAVAKARVTPLKAISIPRLELLAAGLGLRLAVRTSELLQIDRRFYWSDSMDVIFWIHGQSRQYKPFVAHRVAEIQEKSLPAEWRHVPGVKNPADLATRGVSIDELVKENIWTAGPEFLYKSEEGWPKPERPTSEELTEEAQKDTGKALTCATGAESDTKKSEPIDSSRFSSWTRLIRVTAWVLRFVKILKTRELPIRKPHLDVAEIEEGKQYWIGRLQKEKYGDTIAHLRNHKPFPSCPLRSLAPFLDGEGLLRVRGRLQHSDLPYEARHPYILPAKTHVTTLLETLHETLHETLGKHAKGVNATLAELRQEYWIVRGREEVKRVDSGCIVCRQRKRQVAKQIMAPLPSFRVSVPLRAFATSAVDFAGPLIVKLTRRVDAKRWLCLFTCPASRAVHLEMAYSLSTEGFLNTFSRMVARRGKPIKVVSDNGTNFVGADHELGALVQAMEQEKIVEQAANEGIEWSFNPPLGPHHGGLFEALIKSAKIDLKAILGNARVTDEELQTAIAEVEGLMNSRPLTYCSGVAYNPRNRWRYVQDLINQVWRRWNKEFLSLLQNRGKWWSTERDLEVDDVVLMVDQTNPRGKWPLGRVVETMPGADGHVRVVKVIADGKIYTRPISRLCPLVRKEASDTVAGKTGHGGGECWGDNVTVTRPIFGAVIFSCPRLRG